MFRSIMLHAALGLWSTWKVPALGDDTDDTFQRSCNHNSQSFPVQSGALTLHVAHLRDDLAGNGRRLVGNGPRAFEQGLGLFL